MILADKIIYLRKKACMSQEELANMIDVSRQSVSKWESAQSLPDLDKIIALSKIFNVSTDFLLKDDDEILNNDEKDDANDNLKKVSLIEANTYINKRYNSSFKIAFGVFLCIISPITLILLCGLSEFYNLLSDNVASCIGLISLFILVAIAILLFLLSYYSNKEYEFIQTQSFNVEYKVNELVIEKKKKYQRTYNKLLIIGILLCILSIIPLFIATLLKSDIYAIYGVCILLFIDAIAVFLITFASVRMNAYNALLQVEEFKKSIKEKNPIIVAISTAYWLIATAIYLILSFTTNNWKLSWIVFAVAGILFGAISPFLNLIFKKNK